jgi:hypothetical protein
VRKPAVLGLLREIYEDGGVGIGRDLARIVKGVPARRVTSYRIADDLLAQLEQYEYNAREYDPDRIQTTEAEQRRFLATEASEKRSRQMMWTAMRGPTGAAAQGDLDGWLRVERDEWQAKADQLRAELGPRFLNGDKETRTAMVRDWVRNYRERGDLPATRPPDR